MIDYGFFYDIANYGNANWKGNFSPKEIAQNAYDYLTEFEYSKAKGSYHVSPTIQELLALLDEDNTDECECWANEMRYELGLNNLMRRYVIKNNDLYTKDEMARLMESLPKGTKITIELQ